ncbi:unnamed protein product [Alopecurus aequalis]
MALRELGVACLAFLVAATATMCAAQTTPPPLQPMVMPTCPPVPISLSPCIAFVFGVGAAALPSCCAQLQAFFQSQGPCLCAMAKLAPSPFVLALGQVHGMIPNVCNLPSHPCDEVAASPDDSTPPTASVTAPAAAPVDPAAATAPAAEPATTTSTGADAVPGPAAATAPGQVASQGAGSKTDSQGTSQLPELLHAAGARNSAAGTVFISVLLAYVSAMFV